MASPGVVLYLGNWGALCIEKDPSWERRIMTVANQKIEGTPWTEFREARLIRPLKPSRVRCPAAIISKRYICTWFEVHVEEIQNSFESFSDDAGH